MGITNSKYHVGSTISAVAAASFLYYYIFHGFSILDKRGSRSGQNNSQGRGRETSGIVGLKNFGNTCYFNSCIQALAACNLFCSWIERRNILNITCRQDVLNATNASSNDLKNMDHLPFPVIASLHQAFMLINAKSHNRDPCLSETIPSNLIRHLTQHNIEAVKKSRIGRFVLNSHVEQDTHEAFNFILGTIGDECSRTNKAYLSLAYLALLPEFAGSNEQDDDGQPSLPFCKLTPKENAVAKKPAEAGCDSGYRELDFDEEDVRLDSVPSGSSSRNVQDVSQGFVGKFGGGDASDLGNNSFVSKPPKCKRSNDKWTGGRVVSRTDITSTKTVQDTIMAERITFDGTLAVKLVCLTCNKMNPIVLDKFNNLTVTIPKNSFTRGPFTLEELILHSLNPVPVHSVSCDGCLKKFSGAVASSFVKHSGIGIMPVTLCIHINRSEWSNDGTCVKRTEHVKFPTSLDLSKVKRVYDLMKTFPNQQRLPTYDEISKMSERKCNGNNIINYILKAVICHSGDFADTGHFTTYRQAHDTRSIVDGWYFISDCHIIPVSLSHVLSSTAYMLFYEKKTTIIKGIIADQPMSICD